MFDWVDVTPVLHYFRLKLINSSVNNLNRDCNNVTERTIQLFNIGMLTQIVRDISTWNEEILILVLL